MSRPRVLLSCLLFLLLFNASAQVVSEPPFRTIKCGKAEVTCLAISPKGDKILVGLNKGAELYDLESGRKVHGFDYAEDGSTVVYHAAFNDNGEYVVLIGYTGKREVWDVKTGKQEKIITPFRWIPDPRQVKAMGLDMGNSSFDRFYQQAEAEHDGIKARATTHGAIEFTDAEGKALQRLAYPENKDVHHRAPCYFFDDKFITGTDDGRVLFYTLHR